MAEIGIGIIAGLLTTFLIVVLRHLWICAVQPWYEESIYKDTKIEGRWVITYPERSGEEIIELKRKGHKVTGVITVTDGVNKGKTYDFAGTFKNLILTGSYSALNRRTLDRGTFSVMLKNNGRLFEGHCVYYEDQAHAMCANQCQWEQNLG